MATFYLFFFVIGGVLTRLDYLRYQTSVVTSKVNLFQLHTNTVVPKEYSIAVSSEGGLELEGIGTRGHAKEAT